MSGAAVESEENVQRQTDEKELLKFLEEQVHRLRGNCSCGVWYALTCIFV